MVQQKALNSNVNPQLFKFNEAHVEFVGRMQLCNFGHLRIHTHSHPETHLNQCEIYLEALKQFFYAGQRFYNSTLWKVQTSTFLPL